MMITRTGPRRADAFLREAAACRGAPAAAWQAPLSFGVDLGTATIVLCAVDAQRLPVYWEEIRAGFVRDGVVVDFAGAVGAVRTLESRAEEALGLAVAAAATAFPPGVPAADSRACRYVLEQAGIECRDLSDEVSAAQRLLGIADGAIADVGGGSTGVGAFKDGQLVSLTDRPGGGHHLDLILAGALGIAVEQAEVLKRERGAEYEDILTPGVERIGTSIRMQLAGIAASSLHLVGGALLLPHAGEVIERVTGLRTRSYPHANLVTPFGIAVS